MSNLIWEIENEEFRTATQLGDQAVGWMGKAKSPTEAAAIYMDVIGKFR